MVTSRFGGAVGAVETRLDHMIAMKARYGSGHCEVLFTATPKSETLLSHGTRLPDGSLQAFHCFTQRNAVSARQVLNPLEFYTNATSQLTVNNIRLAAMKDPVSMNTYLEQLNI